VCARGGKTGGVFGKRRGPDRWIDKDPADSRRIRLPALSLSFRAPAAAVAAILIVTAAKNRNTRESAERPFLRFSSDGPPGPGVMTCAGRVWQIRSFLLEKTHGHEENSGR
jgi:hypothetical protein